jgi:hypothetical protein
VRDSRSVVIKKCLRNEYTSLNVNQTSNVLSFHSLLG